MEVAEGRRDDRRRLREPAREYRLRSLHLRRQRDLVASATIPAGGTCNAKSPRPCWRASRNGYRYVDRDLTPSGIQQLVLRAGAAGKAQIGLKGKGALLDTPDLPISSLPIRVQLVSSDGQCWDATYSTTFRNQDDRLKAKSD